MVDLPAVDGWQWSSRYPSEAGSAGRARAQCRQALVSALHLPADSPTLDTAELIVSELVSNAVQAEASNLELTVRVERGQLVIQVEDDADGLPYAQRVPVTAARGRGLAIVASVSASCGIEVTGLRKVVWARIELADQ